MLNLIFHFFFLSFLEFHSFLLSPGSGPWFHTDFHGWASFAGKNANDLVCVSLVTNLYLLPSSGGAPEGTGQCSRTQLHLPLEDKHHGAPRCFGSWVEGPLGEHRTLQRRRGLWWGRDIHGEGMVYHLFKHRTKHKEPLSAAGSRTQGACCLTGRAVHSGSSPLHGRLCGSPYHLIWLRAGFWGC